MMSRRSAFLLEDKAPRLVGLVPFCRLFGAVRAMLFGALLATLFGALLATLLGALHFRGNDGRSMATVQRSKDRCF
jgi:hypothetical protein